MIGIEGLKTIVALLESHGYEKLVLILTRETLKRPCALKALIGNKHELCLFYLLSNSIIRMKLMGAHDAMGRSLVHVNATFIK